MFDIANDIRNDFVSIIYKLRQLTNQPLSILDKSPIHVEPPVPVDTQVYNYLWSVDFSNKYSKSEYSHFISDTYFYCLLCYLKLEVTKGEPTRGTINILFSGSNYYPTPFNANYRYRVVLIDNVFSQVYVCGVPQGSTILPSSKMDVEDYAELCMCIMKVYERVRFIDNY